MKAKKLGTLVGMVGAALALSVAAPGVAEAGCAEFDHSHAAFTEILSKHVSEGGVKYKALIAEDEGNLKAYLKTLESCEKSDYDGWSREQKMSFLINTYNAYTIKLIIDKYPLKSIRSITLIPGQVFKKKFIPVKVLGKSPVSLDQIEHGNLRPKFKDARVHFAVNCASASCPELRNEAFVPDRLEEQLDDMGRVFLSDQSKNRKKGDTVELSMIFKWFAEDFKSAGGAAKFAAQYADGDFKAALESDPEVTYLTYDWALNDRS